MRFTLQVQKRLSRTIIAGKDALEIIRNYDLDTTFFYLDPPYINSSQGHYKGYMTENYVDLPERLAKIIGKFLLSSFPNEPLTACH